MTAAPAVSEVEMSAENRMRWAEKYFNPVPNPLMLPLSTFMIFGGLAFLVLSVVLYLIGVRSEVLETYDPGMPPGYPEPPLIDKATKLKAMAFVLGFGGAGVAVVGVLRRRGYYRMLDASRPKPPGRELDRVLAQDLKGIEQRALQVFGLTPDHLAITDPHLWDPVRALGGDARHRDEEKRPIVLFGPVVASGGEVDREDGLLRFREYRVMVVCPTDQHLAIYNTVVSLLTGFLSHEDTFEYQYNHVTEISTNAFPLPADSAHRPGFLRSSRPLVAPRVSRQFRVGVSSGSHTGLTVSVSNPTMPTAQADLRNGVDDVIASIRQVLWDKGIGRS